MRPDGARLTTLVELFAKGQLTLDVAATYPLEEAARALAEARSGQMPGAVVIAPPS